MVSLDWFSNDALLAYIHADRKLINRFKMVDIICSHDPGPMSHKNPGAYKFYEDRLMMVPNYGLFAGTDMIKLICRCAFNDDCLTDREATAIINICHDSRVHNLLMEVNFNEEWQ